MLSYVSCIGIFLSSNAQDFIEESDVIVHPLTALNS